MSQLNQDIAVESGTFYLKKERRRRHRTLLTSHLCEYITTIQGLRYVTDRRLSLVEKIFWLFTFLACVGVCFYWIESVWEKWQDSPVIVTFNEKLEPAWRVPFPSVTICPQVKIVATKFNYAKIRKRYYESRRKKHSNNTKISEEEFRMFKHFAGLCNDKRTTRLIIKEKHFNASLVNDILKMSPNWIETFIYEFHWHGKTFYMPELFKTVLTEEGVCFNMNSLPVYDILRINSTQSEFEYMQANEMDKTRGWTVDGYYDPNEKNPYPLRGSGSSIDLQIAFYHPREYQDEICNSINTGLKVYIQQPEDMPRSTMNFYPVTPDQESSFSLKLNAITSSENIRSIAPDIRQCYFPKERELRYFQIYTASNCELECLTNRTFQLFECVFFYMPHHTSDRICTRDIELYMETVHESIENKTCNCLPSCNTVQYEAEVIKSDYKLNDYILALRKSRGFEHSFNNYPFSSLKMYYKHLRFISMRRSQLFGFTEFLANCGGLLGLFLGFSCLSLVELIYFISLKRRLLSQDWRSVGEINIILEESTSVNAKRIYRFIQVSLHQKLWCVLKKDAKEEKESEKKN